MTQRYVQAPVGTKASEHSNRQNAIIQGGVLISDIGKKENQQNDSKIFDINSIFCQAGRYKRDDKLKELDDNFAPASNVGNDHPPTCCIIDLSVKDSPVCNLVKYSNVQGTDKNRK